MTAQAWAMSGSQPAAGKSVKSQHKPILTAMVELRPLQ